MIYGVCSPFNYISVWREVWCSPGEVIRLPFLVGFVMNWFSNGGYFWELFNFFVFHCFKVDAAFVISRVYFVTVDAGVSVILLQYRSLHFTQRG